MRYFDRVAQYSPTTGQGTVALGTAITNSMLTLAEAGGIDGDEITYLLEEGDDFEIGRGLVGGAVTTVTRATVQVSKIGGIVGTNRMELAGSAKFRLVETAASFNRFEANIGYQALLPEIIKTASWIATTAEAGRMLAYNSAAAGTVTLPDVTASDGEVYHYRTAGNGALILDPSGSQTIEGSATLSVPRGCSALVWANEGKTAWRAMITPPFSLATIAGAAGSFLRYTGTDTAAMQSILGTVAQAGGVPTGAIIERGSNANGEYVRFADGTQICTARLSASGTNITTWAYPAAFVAAAHSVSGSAVLSSGDAWTIATGGQGGATSIAMAPRTQAGGNPSAGATFFACAIGRWF